MSRKKLNFVPFITALLWLLPLSVVLAHGISKADKQAMLDGGNLQYVWLGATHMLTGYDHLLFILGVIFFLTGFRDIVKFITAFTLGHSITLLLATIWGISANYYLVDAVIALSVMYKGFENIDGFKKYLGVSSPNLVGVVFGFGLIHGFGLSTRLQQLPLGDSGIVMRILSFNVGVELGQIAALSIMLLFIIAWRKTKSFTQLSAAANVGLISAGALLFLMQMHGFLHTSFPDDFGFSKDNHHHEHIKMNQKQKGHSHKGKVHSHGGKAHSHNQPQKRKAPHSRNHKVPHSHEGKTNNHGGKAHSHGGQPKKREAHGHSHGKDAPHKHRKTPQKRKASHSHGGKAHSHDGKAHSHGGKPKKRKAGGHSHGKGAPHKH